MNVLPIRAVACSDKGRVREINEDSVAVLEAHGLVILADGMGGYNAGEVASQLAVEAITADLLPLCTNDETTLSSQTIRSAVEVANESILSTMLAEPAYEGMATTVVVALFCDNRVHYGHVGDSRLYRLRDGKLEQLTRDHSMIQALVDEGMFGTVQEALDAGVKGNVLIRGLGIHETVEVDVGVSDVAPGDLYLFCSDGLSNMIPHQDMLNIVMEADGDINDAAERLLETALNNGGLDNVSLALVCPEL
ncbi:PP2C family protein-serine/threonine phosphatase [Sedimenticola selenatireducens]|uniref:PP2C family protein-serine/threonine phosphatase n=1 Tax=Sedimenticola selenatireducens TaxID=191960 RepID=UPI0004B0A4DE|nr:protein phosphatase 2C domain-containing protein [Sedimenticola selenatireducens]